MSDRVATVWAKGRGWVWAILAATLVAGCQGEPVRPGTVGQAQLTRAEPTTPRGAVEAYQQALRDENWEVCWKLLSEDAHAGYEKDAREFRVKIADLRVKGDLDSLIATLRPMGLAVEDLRTMDGQMKMTGDLRARKNGSPEAWQAFLQAEYLREEVSGRRVLVLLRVPGQERLRSVLTTRERVLWHIVSGGPQ